MNTPRAPAIFFLSDYGLDDEFVGVVRAALWRQAPGVAVVDLVHAIPPFDVAAGAQALWRAAPHLGPGVVLAVVDPGVGTDRRCLAVEVDTAVGPRFWVGPDNGLLAPAMAQVAPTVGAVALPSPRGATTFDGRDVMAPAAAALATGQALGSLGSSVDPASLVHLAVPEGRRGHREGFSVLATEVTWVDRFGNVQLAVGAGAVDPTASSVVVRVGAGAHPAKRTAAFEDLAPGELGLLVDANGRLALVHHRGSAAQSLGLAPGDAVELAWP